MARFKPSRPDQPGREGDLGTPGNWEPVPSCVSGLGTGFPAPIAPWEPFLGRLWTWESPRPSALPSVRSGSSVLPAPLLFN